MNWVLVTYESSRDGVGDGKPARLVSGRHEQVFDTRIDAGLRWWGFMCAHPERADVSWLEERV